MQITEHPLCLSPVACNIRCQLDLHIFYVHCHARACARCVRCFCSAFNGRHRRMWLTLSLKSLRLRLPLATSPDVTLPLPQKYLTLIAGLIATLRLA